MRALLSHALRLIRHDLVLIPLARSFGFYGVIDIGDEWKRWMSSITGITSFIKVGQVQFVFHAGFSSKI